MPPAVASIICGIGILGLFFLDRGEKSRVSKALWIPTAWLFLCTSRSVSLWLGMSLPPADEAAVYLEGSPLDRAVLLVLEAGALIVVIRRWRRVGPILRRNWQIGLFFFYAALSMLWSDYPFITLKHWIKGVGDEIMVLIVLTEPSVAGAIRRVFTRLGFVLLPLSMLFIRYYPLIGHARVSFEPVGVSDGKNSLGMLCDISGLALLWSFRCAYNDRRDARRGRRLLALGGTLGLVVWLLWVCNSVTSICALTMASIVMLLSMRPTFRRRSALVHLVISALLAFSLYAAFFQSSGVLKQSLGRDATMTGRTDAWPVMLSIPNNRLLGAGYEVFWLGPRLEKLWEKFGGYRVSEAHNGYIEMLLILGWIGVALLGILFATGYRNVIRAYRRSPDIGSLKIAFFLATVITGFTEAAFRMMSPTMIVFLLATTTTERSSSHHRHTGSTGVEFGPDAAREGAPVLYSGPSREPQMKIADI